MIFTRSWLGEFVNISHINDEQIMDALNKIGLEVAAYKKIEIPKGVMVAKIEDFEKHPDADKLSVCKVNNGFETVTIVCGAKNVQKGAFVALATIGAELPNGITIKQAALRGVESFGMLCSSVELGLPKLNDGIMILDSSLGGLEIGLELNDLPQIADSVIEVEITPNRGDCLSVRGVARELAAYFGLELREVDGKNIKENEKGIGRVLSLHAHLKTSANAAFMVLEKKEEASFNGFLMDYRLALIGEAKNSDPLKNIITYVSSAVGVNLSFFKESSFLKTEEKIDIHLDTLESGAEVIRGAENALYIGLLQDEISHPSSEDKSVIMAATYVAPNVVLNLQDEFKTRDDKLFYRSSRGSEPDLILGLNYASSFMSSCCGFVFYVGYEDDYKPLDREPIKVEINKINKIIGSELDKNHIVSLLRKLYFDVNVNTGPDSCAVTAPGFRHDITNVYDLAEEIVRIKGIESIESKPLVIAESAKINDSLKNYLFLKTLRQNAAMKGFFECVHFIFSDRALQEKFGFCSIKESQELLNPITSELNTLRSTLLLNLLSSASKNANNSQSKIALFESGTIFGDDRAERASIAFVWANEAHKDSIINAGKPKNIELQEFVSKLADIFGGFKLESYSPDGLFLHPYQSARVIKNGVDIGFIAKLHQNAEEYFGLKACFVCEIELSKLGTSHIKAREFSRFQKSVRDLTLDTPLDMPYAAIESAIGGIKDDTLRGFYPVDIYSGKGDTKSLTLRFELQSNEKTLEEGDIANTMDNVLQTLNRELNIGMKQ